MCLLIYNFFVFAAICQAKMKMRQQEVTSAISKACVDARQVAKRRIAKSGTDHVNGRLF